MSAIFQPPRILESDEPYLYCPSCRNPLTGVRATLRLEKTGECRRCGALVPVAKPTPRQRAADFAIELAGVLVVSAIFWLTR